MYAAIEVRVVLCFLFLRPVVAKRSRIFRLVSNGKMLSPFFSVHFARQNHPLPDCTVAYLPVVHFCDTCLVDRDRQAQIVRTLVEIFYAPALDTLNSNVTLTICVRFANNDIVYARSALFAL